MEENTQLPKDVWDKIIQEGQELLAFSPDNKHSYIKGTTDYATKLHQANEKVKELERQNEKMKAQTGSVWVMVSKRLPENDMHMDYPREYCLRCKCDGSRGAVEYLQGNFSEIQDMWQHGPYDVIWWLDESRKAAGEDHLHQANETIKVLTYDNNKLKGEVEGYKEAHDDHKRLVRHLDLLINGDAAAEQASLCDLVKQIESFGLPAVNNPNYKGDAAWVKCWEQKPDTHKVRFKDKHGNEFIGNYSKDTGQYWAYGLGQAINDVIYWRPQDESSPLNQSRADLIREANNRDLGGVVAIQIDREWVNNALVEFALAYHRMINKDIANDAAEFLNDKLKEAGVIYVLSEDESAAGREDWISVDERPLIKRYNEWWELTEDGEKEFIAAVPYRDAETDDTTKDQWWIRHCYIDSEGYLNVKRDNEMDEDVAGWNVSDITHWRPLPEPPKFKQQKD